MKYAIIIVIKNLDIIIPFIVENEPFYQSRYSFVDGLYLIVSSWPSFRRACWIQCHLWMHFLHSEWDNGKWLLFCSLMRCLFVEFLLLFHIWQIGESCFPRWDPIYISCCLLSILYFIQCSAPPIWTFLFFYLDHFMRHQINHEGSG